MAPGKNHNFLFFNNQAIILSVIFVFLILISESISQSDKELMSKRVDEVASPNLLCKFFRQLANKKDGKNYHASFKKCWKSDVPDHKKAKAIEACPSIKKLSQLKGPADVEAFCKGKNSEANKMKECLVKNKMDTVTLLKVKNCALKAIK